MWRWLLAWSRFSNMDTITGMTITITIMATITIIPTDTIILTITRTGMTTGTIIITTIRR